MRDIQENAVSGPYRGSVRIGITIGLHDEAETMWNNGIKQNALYLAKLFQNSPNRHRVTLVNTTAVAITSRLPWDLERFHTVVFESIKDDLDVLIELGGQISEEQTRYLKQRHTKIVSYCCGPEYVQNIEAIIFKRALWSSIFINQAYDEIWVIPQIEETSLHFFKTLRRSPARVVPFVWDPMCLEDRTKDLPFHGEYRPQGKAKRLTVMEPNHDVLKFCLYPMFIAECAYRIVPDEISFLHVANADHLVHESPEFVGLAQHLDLVRNGKASFIGRFDTPRFLADYTDIVISHQWGLALNYFYFDVCWNGYPLVHNAQLCREIGYFYHGNDVEEGAARLVEAIQQHDTGWEAYRLRQRELIGRFLSTNSALVAEYDDLLYQLLDGQKVA